MEKLLGTTHQKKPDKIARLSRMFHRSARNDVRIGRTESNLGGILSPWHPLSLAVVFNFGKGLGNKTLQNR